MKFGPHIRETREAKGLGLRELARLLEIEPAYLSKIEREIFAPPSEALIVKIAGHLGEDPDRLLALAGKIPSDVKDAIIASEGKLAKIVRDWAKDRGGKSGVENGPEPTAGSPLALLLSNVRQ